MKIYSRFLALLCTTTYIGVFFLRVFHYGFFYEAPGEIITGCLPTVLITMSLIIACALVQKPILGRFEAIIQKGRKNKASLTDADKEECWRCYKNFDIVIIVAHVVGFLVGAGSTPFITAMKGIAPFSLIDLLLIELQSIGIGFLCYTVNNVLVKRLIMARYMRDIGIEISDNLSKILNVAVVTCIYVSVMNMVLVPVNLLRNPAGKGLGTFLGYSAIAAVLDIAACIVTYAMIAIRIQRTEKSVSNNLMEQTLSLASATKENAESSHNQSSAVKEIVATMHDSTELANNIGEKIRQVTDLAEKSRDAVISGSKSLQDNVQGLLEIKSTNMLTIEGIKDLNAKISGIWDIVSIINNVADQTKIIAFNAELEASSSGEAGKNFHIVATEIRRLSDNIIDSIKEIRDVINEIQGASDKLILDSEKGTRQIDEGCDSVRSLEGGFASILDSAKATADSSHEILDYVSQLTSSSEQIFITLKQIAAGIESFSQNTANISAASENVKQIASLL